MAYRWEQLILYYHLQLQKFYFTYYDYMNNDNQYPTYSGGLDQFYSSFWIQRRWILEIQIEGFDIKYEIYPLRKQWYDYLDDNNVNDCTEKLPLNSLTFTCLASFIFQDIIFTKIQRILTTAKTYHLEILEKKISISLLIQVIDLLPDI